MKQFSHEHDTVDAWAKRCYFAGRALMDTLLRAHGVGSTQWYILHHLAMSGATPQRDLLRHLQIEKPTLSGVVATLVEKGWVEQTADPNDQRQRVLQLTASGRKRWKGLPDPASLILSIAFEGVAEADLKIARDVLRGATERLNQYTTEREVERCFNHRRYRFSGLTCFASL